jgi:hypothetical protein
METLPVRKDAFDGRGRIGNISRNKKSWFKSWSKSWFRNSNVKTGQENSHASTSNPSLTTRGVFINCLV